MLSSSRSLAYVLRRLQVLDWATITLLFTLGFSVFMTLLMPGNVLRQDEFRRPFWAPFWGLLGDFDLEGIYEYNPAHATDYVSVLGPIGLWFYTFFATIVLVNLLIAQARASQSYT